MVDATFELAENIFEKILSSSQFDVEELEQLEECIDEKLKDVEEKLKHEEGNLDTELKIIQASAPAGSCNFDSLALQCFLNNVLQAIERNAGLEDYVLKDVIEFCHKNQIALPSCIEKDLADDNTLLHSITDKNEEDSYLLWTRICKRLKSGILDLIKNVPVCTETTSQETDTKNENNNDRQIHLFELLLSILPFDDVFEAYCKLREGMLASVFNDINSDSVPSKNCMNITTLDKITSTQICMVHNDLLLLQHFCRSHKVLSCLEKLLEMYEHIVILHVNSFLDYYNKVSYKNINLNPSISEKEAKSSTFSTEDLQNFSKVFRILHHWSENTTKLWQRISNGLELKLETTVVKESSLVKEESMEKSMMHNIFRWKKQFIPYLPLLKKVVPSYIHCVCNVVIVSHKKEIEEADGSCKKYVNENYYLTNTNCPKEVSTHCANLLTLMNEIVIFATSDKDKSSLKELYDVTTLAMIEAFNMHCSFLEEILKDSDSDIQRLYQILCDVSLIGTQLHIWDILVSNNLASKRRGVLQIVSTNIEDIAEKSADMIIKYHIKIIKSTIVFDNHGNNWTDDKPFFEGERCSFTIQMWNYYIRGLVHDLQKSLPTCHVKKILNQVCSDMLVFFTSYYTAIKTSYRRVKQLKADVQMLITIFRWLLLYTADSNDEILNVDNKKMKYWHALCRQLLEVMIVNCSPLSQGCDHLQNPTITSNEHLMWYDQTGPYRFSRFQNCLVLDRLSFHPLTDWEDVKKLLIHKNTELPLLMLTHAGVLRQPVEENKENRVNEMFVEGKVISYEPVNKHRLCSELYNILRGGESRKAFLHFMASLMEEDDSKSFKISSANQELPLWLQLITKDLNSVFKRILNPALDLLFAESKHKAAPSFKFNTLQTLPCGCSTAVQKQSDKFLTGAELFHKCLMQTLVSLLDNMSLLPTRIWDVLVYVKSQPRFSQSWIKTPNLGTKILASLLYNWFVTKENFLDESPTLPQYTCDNITAFAELLWHIIYNLTYDVTENPNISMDIQKGLQMTGEVITKALDRLHAYFDKESLNYNADESFEADFSTTNQYTYEDIHEQELSSLKYVRAILASNQVTIKHLLQNPESDIKGENNRILTECLQMRTDFNPLQQYIIGGQQKIDHFELLEGLVDWGELIPHVSQPKWRAMIYNRWEFQENAGSILRDDEKEQVATIRKLFEGGEEKDDENTI